LTRILDDTAIEPRLSERQFFDDEAVYRVGPTSDLPFKLREHQATERLNTDIE